MSIPETHYKVTDEGMTEVLDRPEVEIEKPRLYKVIFLNDDYTPMAFVMDILRTHFNKSEQEAADIMLIVHHTGKGIAGVYTYDIATTKAIIVMKLAAEKEYPLTITTEPE